MVPKLSYFPNYHVTHDFFISSQHPVLISRLTAKLQNFHAIKYINCWK